VIAQVLVAAQSVCVRTNLGATYWGLRFRKAQYIVVKLAKNQALTQTLKGGVMKYFIGRIRAVCVPTTAVLGLYMCLSSSIAAAQTKASNPVVEASLSGDSREVLSQKLREAWLLHKPKHWQLTSSCVPSAATSDLLYNQLVLSMNPNGKINALHFDHFSGVIELDKLAWETLIHADMSYDSKDVDAPPGNIHIRFCYASL